MPEPTGSATAHLPRSIATVSLSGTLPEKLDAAATVGFDAVEIFENDLLTYDGSPAEIRYLAESLGLKIFCFQPSPRLPFISFGIIKSSVKPIRPKPKIQRQSIQFQVMAPTPTIKPKRMMIPPMVGVPCFF